MTESECWDYLIDYGYATEEELQLATCLLGYSVETLEQVLDVRTGYRSFSQLKGEDEEEEEDQDDDSEV